MYKKIASIITVFILLAALLVPVATVKAQAIESITLSSSSLVPNGAIEVIIYAPGYTEDYITLRIQNASTGSDITVYNATTTTPTHEALTEFYAYKYASGYYVAYILENDTDRSKIPAYPKAEDLAKPNIVSMPESNLGVDYKIYVPGTDVEATFTVEETTFSLSIDRDVYPVAGYIKLTVVDQDHNLDPTAVDENYLASDITITYVKVERPSTGEIFEGTPSTFTDLAAAFDASDADETKVNSATFEFELNLTKFSETIGTSDANADLHFGSLEDGDLITITLEDHETGETVDIEFSIKSEAPSISVSTPNFAAGVDITVTWFDANVKSWEEDKITGQFTVVLMRADTYDVLDKDTLELEETDVNTAEFTDSLDIAWNDTTWNKDDGTINVPLDLAKDGYNFILKVNGTYNGEPVEKYVDLELHAPTLSLDKEEYYKEESVVLTLVDPDLNDDASTLESYNVTGLPGELDSKYAEGTVTGYKYLEVTLEDVTKGTKPYYSGKLTFVETGRNTGIFTASLDLSKLDPADYDIGDTLKITIKDYTSGETVSAEFKIVRLVRTITLDRSTYPVPESRSVKLHITFEAPDLNSNPHARDKAYVNVTLIDYKNNEITTYKDVELTETGENTGVFKGTKDIPTTYGTDLYRGKVIVWYDADESGDRSSDDVQAEARFALTTASLSVEPTAVKYGGEVTITVNDPDADVDSATADYVWVEIDGSYVKLTETEENSGVFEATLVVGKDITGYDPGDSFDIKYTDNATIDTEPGGSFGTLDLKYTVTILTHTGKLLIDKTEYGPGAMMNITLIDPDLNLNLDAPNHATVWVKIEGIGTYPVDLEETGINTGVFMNTSFALDMAAPKDLIGKTIAVAYNDEANAEGEPQAILQYAKIVSADPVITFNKKYYDIGEIVEITIKDPDANKDPSAVETYYHKIRIYSDSDPVGVTKDAYETGTNTGEFKAFVRISDTFGAGVYAKYGDKIYVEVIDEYPADYPETESSKTFTAEAIVGVPVEKPFEIAAPTAVDPSTGAPVNETTVGKMLSISTTLENVDVVDRSFAYVVQVKDASGVVVYLSYIEGTVPAGYSFTPAISWTPTAPGVYTIEVFVWKSIAEPMAYSPVLTLTITVSE